MVKADKKWYAHMVIGLILMMGVGFLPPIEPITPLGMRIFGIFLGVIYMWCFCGCLVPSLLAVVALIASGYAAPNAVISGALGNSIAWSTIFVLAILGVVEEAKIVDVVVNFFLGLKIINGRPWLFTFMILLLCFATSALVSGMVANFMFWTLLYTIGKKLGMAQNDKYLQVMAVAIVYVVCIGSTVLPFKDTGLFTTGTYQGLSGGDTVPQGTFILCLLILGIAGLVGVLLLMKFIFRVDMTAVRAIDTSIVKNTSLKLDGYQKCVAMIFMAFIITLLMLCLLPANSWLSQKLNNLSAMGIMMFYFCLLCFIRKDGNSIANFQELAGKKIYWDLYFLVAVAMYLGNALVSDGTGITEFLRTMLSGVFANMSATMFMTLLAVLTLIITNVANNGVTYIIFITISLTFAPVFPDISQHGMVALLTWAMIIAFLLPSSSINGAILYANSYGIEPKVIVKYVIPIILLSCVIIAVIGVPLCKMMF